MFSWAGSIEGINKGNVPVSIWNLKILKSYFSGSSTKGLFLVSLIEKMGGDVVVDLKFVSWTSK